jgi:hypothetical protein
LDMLQACLHVASMSIAPPAGSFPGMVGPFNHFTEAP